MPKLDRVSFRHKLRVKRRSDDITAFLGRLQIQDELSIADRITSSRAHVNSILKFLVECHNAS